MTTNISYSLTITDGSPGAAIFDAAKYWKEPQAFYVVFKGYFLVAGGGRLYQREISLKAWVYGAEWERDDKKKPTGYLRIKALVEPIEATKIPRWIGNDVEIHFDPRRRKGGIITQ